MKIVVFQVFGLLRQGDGKVIIAASFEDKMQTVRLPVIETPEAVWDFMEILFEELRCECFYEREGAADGGGTPARVNGVKKRKSVEDDDDDDGSAKKVKLRSPPNSVAVADEIGRSNNGDEEGGGGAASSGSENGSLSRKRKKRRSKNRGSDGGATSRSIASSGSHHRHRHRDHHNHRHHHHHHHHHHRVHGEEQQPLSNGGHKAKRSKKKKKRSSFSSSSSSSSSAAAGSSSTKSSPTTTSSAPSAPLSSSSSSATAAPPPAATRPKLSKSRGRPPGAKNKVRRDKADPSSAAKNPPNVIVVKHHGSKQLSKASIGGSHPSTPSSWKAAAEGQSKGPKRLPIYHNAHKLYQEEQQLKGRRVGSDTADVSSSAAKTPLSPSSSSSWPPRDEYASVVQDEIYSAPPTLLPEVPLPAASYHQLHPSSTASPDRHHGKQPVFLQSPSQPPQVKLPTTMTTPATATTTTATTTAVPTVPCHQPLHSVVVASPQQPPQPQKPLPANPTEWTIDHVIGHLSHLDPSLGPHVEMFRSHEIDGNALLLLNEDMMMKYMDMKLGPALKITNIVNMLQGKKHVQLGSSSRGAPHLV